MNRSDRSLFSGSVWRRGDHLAGRVVDGHARGQQTQPGRLEPDGHPGDPAEQRHAELVVIDVRQRGQVADAGKAVEAAGRPGRAARPGARVLFP